jgi:activating signal cointegrator complex subunit 2
MISGGTLSSEHMQPRSTPPMPPQRRNVFDDDEFDRLQISESRLHRGNKRNDRTADELLKDRSMAPSKAAILSALAAFDSDDDERDDTYDTADVGGAVDSAAPPGDDNSNMREEDETSLFSLYKQSPEAFGRDSDTRRSKLRFSMKQDTGMTDEEIEGWAIMLSRDPRKMRRLESRGASAALAQPALASTAYRASPAGSDAEDSGEGGSRGGRGGYRGRVRGGDRGGRGRGGTVAGPANEKDTQVARQRKTANRGSRANHNRRDQRAKKMARGGFPPAT